MKLTYEKLGKYITESKIKNVDGKENKLYGVTLSKKIIPSIANTIGTDLTKYKLVKKNQFIYGPVTSRNGDKISITLFSKDSGIVSSSYKVFEINNTSIINPDYLMLWFKRSEFDRYARYMSHGSVREVFDWDDMCNVVFPLYDMGIQNKIIRIYNFFDNMICIKKEINKNLESHLKAIFKNWFVEFNYNYNENQNFISSELGEIPYGWEVKKLGDGLLDSLESGKRPKGGISDINEGIPSIGAENISGLGIFDYSKNKLVSFEFFEKMKKGKIKDKDVLLYKDGAQIGRKSLFMYDFPFKKCCVNEHVFILRTNKKLSPYYLYFWLDQKWMTNEIINLNSNSAQPGINQMGVKSLPILIPNNKLMKAFNDLTEPIMTKIFSNALENQRLEKLRDTLLPKLMSGEIDVSKVEI